MATLALCATTGDQCADTLLQGAIGVVEACFPERIRGYYLIGSYANGSAVASSDLDVVVVFKHAFVGDEQARCWRLSHHCSLLSPMRIDLAPRCEDELFERGSVSLKLASQLVYGQDIRTAVGLEPLEEYLLQVLSGFLFYTALLRGEPERLVFPLDYPDPHAPFYGYERWGLLLANRFDIGLRTLVNSTTLAATFLVGVRAGRHVGTKRDAVEVYKHTVAGAWTNLLEDVYHLCKQRWGYRVPDTPAEQAELRRLCQRILGFENDVLEQCREYILGVLADGKDHQKIMVAQSLQKIIFVDAEVAAALERLTRQDQAVVRQAALEALVLIPETNG
ncbi:MAG TPA: nucleotidyltransferase domain-containing protein [Roseiflexaceae bacterium]|nr:nucleotidyltransferase domain-containing protein [Roseiflexaceae bacterium]